MRGPSVTGNPGRNSQSVGAISNLIDRNRLLVTAWEPAWNVSEKLSEELRTVPGCEAPLADDFPNRQPPHVCAHLA